MHGLSVPVGKLGYQLSLPRTLSSVIMSRSETEPTLSEGQAGVQIQRPLDSQRDLTRLGRPKGEEPPRAKFPIGGSIIRNSPAHDSSKTAETNEAEIESAEFTRISSAV